MKKLFFLALTLCLSCYIAVGQTKTISGTVTSAEDGNPLPGVTVLIKGTNVGVSTNLDGIYTIDVNTGEILLFSSIGMLSQEIGIENQSTVDVILEPDVLALEEVIVTGYAVQKKTNLTGSVVKVDAPELKKVTSSTVSGLLQGQAAGVYVSPNSGRPGSISDIVIRGKGSINSSNAPLWVVDGVIISGEPKLNSEEVENISILKDASATALYGSRGANGVILVTTKTAKTGINNITFSARTGVSQFTQGNFKLMNSQQMYDYWGGFENQESLPDYYDPSLTNVDTDWWKEGTQNSITHDYNISLTSSNDNMKSYLLVGYYDESGAIKDYDYTRYNARLNLDYQALDWLKVKPKLAVYYTKDYRSEGSLYSLNTLLPWDNPYDAAGNPVNAQDPDVTWYGRDGSNYLYDNQWNYSKSSSLDFNGNLDFHVRINESFSFESTNNINYYYSNGMSYTDPRSNAGLQNLGEISNTDYKNTARFTNQLLRYSDIFGDHSLNALVAYEYSDYTFTRTRAIGKGIAPDTEILDVTSEASSVDGYKRAYKVQSYLFNVSYAFTDRYLAQFSFRRDGSSKFGRDEQYGNFFTVSAGWNIHNESFFNLDAIDIFKLKASYGSVGNTPPDNTDLAFNPYYGHLGLYALDNQYDGNPSAFPSQLENPNMTWEKAYSTNVALDVKLYKRFNFLVEGYIKNTEDLLERVNLATLTGYEYYWANIGSVKNAGLEATASAEILKSRDLKWNLSFNIGLNRNEITSLNDGLDVTDGYYIRREGEDINSYYMEKWAGVDSDTGDPLWEVVDETTGAVTLTTEYNEATRQIVGCSTPDYFGGIFTNFEFKGITLSMNFNYVVGNDIYNSSRELFDSDGAYPTFNQMVLADDWSRWENPGDNATHPLAYYGGNNASNKRSSRYIEDGSFLRLRNLRLGYNLPSGLMKKFGMKQGNIYFSADNLHTWTNYSGADPEASYPLSKKFMLGLSLTF